MFGVHLQLETVCTWPVPHSQMGSIARQLEHLLSKARYQMEETFPSLSTTICMIFSENILHLLVSISSSMIGNLMIQLRIILFSPLLPTMQFLDVILFVILRFLQSMVLIVQWAEHSHSQQVSQWLLELEDNCEKYSYQHKLKCLHGIRVIFIDIWCKMLEVQ